MPSYTPIRLPKLFRLIILSSIFLLTNVALADEQERLNLARHYSPIMYQHVDTAGDNSLGGYSDLFTNFDYDGTWSGDLKWDNLNLYIGQDQAKATVYYSVVETTNYWFIYYAIYHPRDWSNVLTEFSGWLTMHENDMEAITLMVRKGDGFPGNLVAAMSMSHNVWIEYPIDLSVNARNYNGYEDDNSDGVTYIQNSQLSDFVSSGHHPRAYMQSKGHGIFLDANSNRCLTAGGSDPDSWLGSESPIDNWNLRGFPGNGAYAGTGVVYYCSSSNIGETISNIWEKIINTGGDQPLGADVYFGRWAKYQLLPIEELWEKRSWKTDNQIGREWMYVKDNVGFDAFYGPSPGDNEAHPPWSIPAKRINELYTGVPVCPPYSNISNPGEIFYDPISAFPEHFEGLDSIASEDYVYNPYIMVGSCDMPIISSVWTGEAGDQSILGENAEFSSHESVFSQIENASDGIMVNANQHGAIYDPALSLIITQKLDNVWGDNLNLDTAFNTVFDCDPGPDQDGVFEVVSATDEAGTLRSSSNPNEYYFSYDGLNDGIGTAISVDQWVDYLEGIRNFYQRIGRLTIFCHGNVNNLKISDNAKLYYEDSDNVYQGWLNVGRDQNTRTQLVKLREVLADDAHILLFSCRVGNNDTSDCETYDNGNTICGSPDAEQLIQEIANLTGATVHANSNSTGDYVANGDSDWTLEIVKTPDFNLLPAPSNMQASITSERQVSLSWDAPGEISLQVTGYNIYYGTSPDQLSTKIEGIVNPPHIIENLSCNTLYYFAVSAIFEDSIESNLSGTVYITSSPDIPQNLTISNVLGGFRISWDQVPGDDITYKIYWGNDDSVSEVNYAKILETSTTYYDHIGLVNGYTYYYKVMACETYNNVCSELSAYQEKQFVKGESDYFIFSGNISIPIDTQNLNVGYQIRAVETSGANLGNEVRMQENGQFQMALFPGTYNVYGRYWISDYQDGYTSFGMYSNKYCLEQNLIVNGDLSRNYTLPIHTLTGKVMDTNGSGIPNVNLEFQNYQKGCYGNTTSSSASGNVGNYELYILPGDYSLAVEAPPNQYPPFEIKALHIFGDTVRNITLSYDYTVLDEAIAAISTDLNLHFDLFDVIDQGQSKSYDVAVTTPRDLLELILNWGGSEVRAEVFQPNGSLYGDYQSQTPPIIVQIFNPEIGNWSVRVTGIEVPYENYPIAVVAGITPNDPPVADANGPYSGYVNDEISFDASGSYDSNGDIVLYEWDWDNDGIYDHSSATATASHTWNVTFSGNVGLRVTDNEGDQDYDYADVIVELGPQNQSPVAIARPDLIVSVDYECSASISLDGSSSYDPDSDPLHYLWKWDNGTASGVNPNIQLPIGIHTIELIVNDGMVNSEPSYCTITVRDETKPEISVLVTPDILLPPNHKMIPVLLDVSASDNCNGEINCKIISVTSDESVNGTGDGDKEPDWVITGDLTVNLRAERSGTGDGRVYTITVECTDESGNKSTSDVTVTVPHDKGNKKKNN